MTQNQLSMLRSQMAGQQLIVQPQTIFQTQSGQNIAIPLANLGQQGIYINQQQLQQTQQNQQQQQQQVKQEEH
jgi:FMN phosphatase YigB (HAD superfamily)